MNRLTLTYFHERSAALRIGNPNPYSSALDCTIVFTFVDTCIPVMQGSKIIGTQIPIGGSIPSGQS